ncbi:GST C-terminal domain-containing protein [Hirschfeldia incana]|nr:GST C-terminal domain-containing protein [Hirschfeldia incana]
MAFCTAPSLSFPSFTTTTISVAPRRFIVRMSNNSPKPTTTTTSIFTSATKLLWGPSLPPGLLISTVRTAWSTVWQLMMTQLAPSDSSGSYTRPTSQFRLNPTQFPSAASSELHLYVGLPCPWAHRTLIVRALKGLDDAVSVSVASPGQDGSWEFKDNSIPVRDKDKLIPGLDKANRCRNLKEVYKSRTGGYEGRCTVPMLWDSRKKDVVCNESYDIIEFFNSGLNEFARNPSLDLTPPELKGKIEAWNQIVYPKVNNGVYRCGFAQSQDAYDRAVNELFSTLDEIEHHLGSNRYLCGERLTLADVCLFTTLIRFDPVYNILFKCTKKKLVEYPNLYGYLRDIYQIPGVAATCDIPAIMGGYYKTLFPLNASGIQPAISLSGDQDSLLIPHHRDSVGKAVEAQHAV